MAVAAYFGETLKSGSGQLAAADYSGSTTTYAGPGGSAQFQAVQILSGGVTLVSTAGVGQIKVLTNKPKTGDACALVDVGETKLVAGAAVAIGALLMVDSSGRFITYVDNGANVPVGEARMAASAAGDIFTGFIFPNPGSAGQQSAIADGLTAHASGGQASATQLVAGWNRLSTVATLNDSAALPSAQAGSEVIVVNDGAAAAKIYALNGSTDTIDGTAGSTGVTLTNAKRTIFVCLTAGKWISIGAGESA